jgi:type II secretory pathway pseudopilin PulG
MMKMLNGNWGTARRNSLGFTLAEVMVGSAILGLVGVALATGISYGFALSDLNSQNLRAAQILTEKMDLIRACNWAQVTNGYNFIPQTFTAPFYSSGSTTNGVIFQGEVDIGSAPVVQGYGTNLRQVTVTVTWLSGKVPRTRSMSTLVSPYGIQTYSY